MADVSIDVNVPPVTASLKEVSFTAVEVENLRRFLERHRNCELKPDSQLPRPPSVVMEFGQDGISQYVFACCRVCGKANMRISDHRDD